MQVAKVYVSVYSDERGKEIVMEGLKAKTKLVRAGLKKRMQLRLTLEVRSETPLAAAMVHTWP